MSLHNDLTGKNMTGRTRKAVSKQPSTFMPSSAMRKRKAYRWFLDDTYGFSGKAHAEGPHFVLSSKLAEGVPGTFHVKCLVDRIDRPLLLAVSTIALKERFFGGGQISKAPIHHLIGTGGSKAVTVEADDAASEDSFKKAFRELRGSIDPELSLEI